MPSARERNARRSALPSTLWALGAIAVGCVYPELSSSPDWRDEAAAGEGAVAGSGESNGGGGKGGRPGTAGTGNDAGAGATPAIGGEGGASGPDIIHASVLDQYGEPVEGIKLLIDDLELETDENGEASTPGEDRASFTATLVVTELKTVLVYEGVTRRRLRFVAPRAPSADPVTGTLGGTVQTPAPKENLSVFFVARDGSHRSYGTLDATDVAPNVRYSIEPSWAEGTLTGDVQAFNWQIDPGFNVPSSFYLGAAPATLAPEAMVDLADIALEKLVTRELPVSVKTLSGATRTDFLLFGAFTVLLPSVASPVTYVIPDDAAFDALVPAPQFLSTCTLPDTASSGVIVPLHAALDAIDDACPEPPTLTSPPDGATGVPLTTPLVFAPAQAGCNSVFARHIGSEWTVTVNTLAAEAVLPDLAAFGIEDSEHEVSWTASTSTPCKSIDDYLAGPVTTPPGDLPTITFARSSSRTFTTEPP